MNAIKGLLAAMLVSLVSVSALAEITLSTVAEVEKVTVDEEGNEVVTYLPADLVVPGDVVRYSITATNKAGEKPADKVVITNPVPVEMVYLADSAQSSALGAGTTIEFSIDGGVSWGALASLVVIEADGSKRSAAASDVNAVRWKLNFSLQGGDTARVWYKARLQ